MKYLFLLSGDFIEIAEEEAASIFGMKNNKLIGGRLLLADLDNEERSIRNLSKRLALTKCVYRSLFECKIRDLADLMEKYNWASVYKKSFCLRIHCLDNKKFSTGSIKKIYSEKELAHYIWRSVKNPKVDLENPETEIDFFFGNGKVYCGLLIAKNSEDFEARKPHRRPFPHPSSLHPKLARALVNLSEIKENETLLDPFCGTGGFLIEAGLMKIRSTGYDINKALIQGCKENLDFFKIKNCQVKSKNALKISEKIAYAVTDLPYGLNSNACSDENDWKKHRINKKIETKNFKKSLEKFYLDFLKILRKNLEKKAVIVFPSYADYKKLLRASDFTIEKEFSQYVHRSLSRKIVKIS